LGQKVHPTGLRLGITNTWNSRWFSEKDYATQLHEDLMVRSHIKKRLSHAGVSRIDMERAASRLRINIHTARPGIIIGKKGVEIDKLMKDLQARTGKEVFINIMEIRKPEIDAQLVAENVALQFERRVSFRRAMKRAVLSAIRFGAGGVRINCSGRLAGHEIARREWYREGRVPLHTLRADIDYGFAEAHTTHGLIGVKVWIYHGEKPRPRSGGGA
jgi:small subunit ribosomal protein S3